MQQLIAKESSNFEDGKPRRVPVLKNGKWVTELASEVQSRRQSIPASQSRSLPGRSGGGGGSLHEFELTFEGSVGLGMSLKEHEGATSSGAVPPPGYRVLVGAVAPGSLASQQKLKPGVALIAINGQSLRGLGRKDALRILGMAGKGVRACRFCDFSGVGEAPEQGSSGQAAQQSAHSGGAPGGAAFATGLVQEGGGAGAAGGSGGGGGGAAASAPSGSDGVIEVPPPVDTRSTAARLEKLFGAHLNYQSDLAGERGRTGRANRLPSPPPRAWPSVDTRPATAPVAGSSIVRATQYESSSTSGTGATEAEAIRALAAGGGSFRPRDRGGASVPTGGVGSASAPHRMQLPAPTVLPPPSHAFGSGGGACVGVVRFSADGALRSSPSATSRTLFADPARTIPQNMPAPPSLSVPFSPEQAEQAAQPAHIPHGYAPHPALPPVMPPVVSPTQTATPTSIPISSTDAAPATPVASSQAATSASANHHPGTASKPGIDSTTLAGRLDALASKLGATPARPPASAMPGSSPGHAVSPLAQRSYASGWQAGAASPPSNSLVPAPAGLASAFGDSDVMPSYLDPEGVAYSSGQMGLAIDPRMPRPWRAELRVDLGAVDGGGLNGDGRFKGRPPPSSSRAEAKERLDAQRTDGRSEDGIGVRKPSVLHFDGTRRMHPRSVVGTSVASERDWYGDLADPDSVASRARLYTDPSALPTKLGAGGGSIIQGSGGWQDAPVRLVKAEYLIELWRTGAPLPPRQAAPEHAFYDGPPDRARLIALACPWLGDEHPDVPDHETGGRSRGINPGGVHRRGTHLRTIAPLLLAYINQAPPVREKHIRRAKQGELSESELAALEAEEAEADAWYDLPVAVYWDFISIYHDARGSTLTPHQEALHLKGLAASAYLFAHAQVAVWIQARLSHAATGHQDAMEGLHRQDALDTLSRGKCLQQLHLASLLHSASSKQVLDLGRLSRTIEVEHVSDFAKEVESVCTLRLPSRYPFDLRIQALTTPARFAHLVSGCQFLNKAEREVVLLSYADAFADISQFLETLWAPQLGWTDEDAVVLAEALPLFGRLRCINLAGNSELSDHGIATLAASLPPGLEELDVSLTAVGNAGASLLSIKMPPALRALNLYETATGPAARRACALNLAAPELNRTGATRRLTKLVEPPAVVYSDPNGVGGMVVDGSYILMDGTPVPAADAVALPPDILAEACAQRALETPFMSAPPLSAHSYDELFVVAVVGDPGCGKTALLERFANDCWRDDGPTIGVDFRMRSLRLASRDVTCRLQVWDAGGADSAQPGSNSIYTGVHGVLICYDAADRDSLASVRKWMKTVDKYAPAGVCKILVGNKEDAEPSTPQAYAIAQSNAAAVKAGSEPLVEPPPKAKRVEPKHGEKLASSLGVQFVAASAFEGGGVDEAFAVLTEQMYEKREMAAAKGTRSGSQSGRRGHRPTGAELLVTLAGGAGAASPHQQHPTSARRASPLSPHSHFVAADQYHTCDAHAGDYPEESSHPYFAFEGSPYRGAKGGGAPYSGDPPEGLVRTPAEFLSDDIDEEENWFIRCLRCCLPHGLPKPPKPPEFAPPPPKPFCGACGVHCCLPDNGMAYHQPGCTCFGLSCCLPRVVDNGCDCDGPLKTCRCLLCCIRCCIPCKPTDSKDFCEPLFDALGNGCLRTSRLLVPCLRCCLPKPKVRLLS